jgi:hypothetical protein
MVSAMEDRVFKGAIELLQLKYVGIKLQCKKVLCKKKLKFSFKSGDKRPHFTAVDYVKMEF